jgi:hypothetical protein
VKNGQDDVRGKAAKQTIRELHHVMDDRAANDGLINRMLRNFQLLCPLDPGR